MEKYMAQSLHIGWYGPSTDLPFGIRAIYFDLVKVNSECFVDTHRFECWTSFLIQSKLEFKKTDVEVQIFSVMTSFLRMKI